MYCMLCIACFALHVAHCVCICACALCILYFMSHLHNTPTDHHYRCVSPFGHTRSYACSIECGEPGGASVEEKLSPSQVRLNADDVVLASPRNQTQAIQVKDFLLKTHINCIYSYHTNMQWYSRIRNLNGPP